MSETSEIIVDGSDRQRKYPIKVGIENGGDERNKTGGEILVIKDESQKPEKGTEGISIDTLGSKTIIEFSKSNKKFIDPVLNALKKQGKFPWNRTYRGSTITTRIGGLGDLEINEIEDLIEKTIRLQLKSEA